MRRENDFSYQVCSTVLNLHGNANKKKDSGVTLIKPFQEDSWVFYCFNDKSLIKFSLDISKMETQYDIAFNSGSQSLDDYCFLDEFSIGVITGRRLLTIIDAYSHTKLKEVAFDGQAQLIPCPGFELD